MHTLTIRTKFTFGDRAGFDSPTQRRSGTATIFAIVSYAEGPHDYMIQLDGEPHVQGGIQEDEISHLNAD